jgi:hypothetical protein
MARLQKHYKATNGNGGGKGQVIPIRKPKPMEQYRFQKSQEALGDLDKKNGYGLIEAATYSQFPKVRKEALSRISHDWRMLRYVVQNCPYPDTLNSAQTLMEKAKQESGE